MVLGYAQEKRLHRGLLAILQNPQQAVFALFRSGRDNRRKIPMALFQGNLVYAHGRQTLELTPIHALPKPVINNVPHLVVADLLLVTDILNRAVDQEPQYMLSIRLGHGLARLVPRQVLRRGGVARTVVAEVTARLGKYIGGHVQYRQMPELDFLPSS